MLTDVDRAAIRAQAQLIHHTLLKFGMWTMIPQSTVGYTAVTHTILLQEGVRVEQVTARMAENLAYALGVENVHIQRENGQIRASVPLAERRPIPFQELMRGAHDAVRLCKPLMGMTDANEPLHVRFTSPDVAHILIAGTTGSGKSNLLRTMIASLALTHEKKELSMVLIDPRARELMPFRGIPHLARGDVDYHPDTISEALHSLTKVMERRDREYLQTGKCTAVPVLVVIDELADLMMMADQATTDALTRLAQRGRGAGIHLLVATQKPNVAVIGALLKANVPTRVCLRVGSTADANTVFGHGGSNAHLLPPWMALLEGPSPQPIRFQVPLLSIEEAARIMDGVFGNPPSNARRHDELKGEWTVIDDIPAIPIVDEFSQDDVDEGGEEEDEKFLAQVREYKDALSVHLAQGTWRIDDGITAAFSAVHPDVKPGGRRFRPLARAVEELVDDPPPTDVGGADWPDDWEW